MLNIVVPMAGAGSRFAKVGYVEPKPLIPIHGIPMIRYVIENLRPACEHRFIFICQQSHDQQYGLGENLRKWAPGSVVVTINGMTEGAACTVLAAQEYIDNGNQLMIANSDQFVDYDINDYLGSMSAGQLDGLIMTMSADDPKWSFIAADENGAITRVVEKEVISNEATVGIYNFARGADFVAGAKEMIAMNERVNNEFYVAPVYNRLIARGQKFGYVNVGSEQHGMYGLGIPADLDFFLAHPVSRSLDWSAA